MQLFEILHKSGEINFVKAAFGKNDQWLAGVKKNTDLKVYQSLTARVILF